MSGRLKLTLFAVPRCAPCEIVKSTLRDPDFGGAAGICLHEAGIEEIRRLRRESQQRLVFPVLILSAGEQELARRVGVRSLDAGSVRADILGWIEDARAAARDGGTTAAGSG